MSTMPYNADHFPVFATVQQVAETLAVGHRTVRRWIEEGKLKAIKTRAGKGHIRIPREAMAEFLENSAA